MSMWKRLRARLVADFARNETRGAWLLGGLLTSQVIMRVREPFALIDTDHFLLDSLLSVALMLAIPTVGGVLLMLAYSQARFSRAGRRGSGDDSR